MTFPDYRWPSIRISASLVKTRFQLNLAEQRNKESGSPTRESATSVRQLRDRVENRQGRNGGSVPRARSRRAAGGTNGGDQTALSGHGQRSQPTRAGPSRTGAIPAAR